MERSDVVIATGGLGPTCDDCTREVVAKIFDSKFHLDKEIYNDLKQRYGNSLASIEDQASVPDKAIVIKNSIGTAPGFIFCNERSVLVLVPGAPKEMKKWLELMFFLILFKN